MYTDHPIFSMTSTRITLFTSLEHPLTRNVTIALTVVPPIIGEEKHAITPVAWKVLEFKSHDCIKEDVHLYPSRRITKVKIRDNDSSNAQFVIFSDGGAGLGPSQSLAFSADRWTSEPLFDIPSYSSFVVNRDAKDRIFCLGSSASGVPFEPMALIPSLKPKAAALVQYPSWIQAYEVEPTCLVGQLLHNPGRGLFTDRYDQSIPLRMELNEKTILNMSYKLSSGPNDRLILEEAEPRQVHARPQPLLIPTSPVFSEALATPPGTPRPVFYPLDIRSPVFLQPLYTPPQTPQYQISPSRLPTTITSPTFLSPLLTPADDSHLRYF